MKQHDAADNLEGPAVDPPASDAVDAAHACPHCRAMRVRIAGSVAGVAACELVTDSDRIVLGSSVHADLVVDDPLVPRRAVELRHVKDHVGTRNECHSHWMIIAKGGARVYVNRTLVRKGLLNPGDSFALGCHQFVFDDDTDTPRDRRMNVNVRDLCDKLIAGSETPSAFLRGCPAHRHGQRLQRAFKWTGGVAAAILMLLLLLRPEVGIEQVQEPLEVVMIQDTTKAPSPEATRTIDQVERRAVDAPVDVPEPQPIVGPKPELAPSQFDAQPVAFTAPVQHAQEVELSTGEVTPLDPMPIVTDAQSMPTIDLKRSTPTLVSSAPQRRLSIDEVSRPEVRRELVAANITVDAPMPVQAAQPIAVSQPMEMPELPPLDLGRDKRLALLASYEPTPLTFEDHQGARIPVARAPKKIDAIDVPDAAPAFRADGKVTEEEAKASTQMGQLRIHGPNPQIAKPDTFCYMIATTHEGKDYVYISFVCSDPDPSRIRHGHPEGPFKDDSVEVFLDTDYDRVDYYHLIVSAKGRVQARFCANGDQGINNKGTPWNANAQIKTTINQEAKQWTCEIMIPFDSLGGKPKKGDRWAVNFTRAFRGQGYPDSVYQNWFLVYKGNSFNYHHPDLYGVYEW